MKTFKLLKDGTINIKFQFGSQKDDFVIVNLNKKETRQIFDMVNKPKANKFEFFWKLYPKKVNRKPALQNWIRLNCDDNYDAIARGLKLWIQSPDWSDIKFIPYPSTFLNQERWDSPPTKESSNIIETRKPWSNVA